MTGFIPDVERFFFRPCMVIWVKRTTKAAAPAAANPANKRSGQMSMSPQLSSLLAPYPLEKEPARLLLLAAWVKGR